ncbi:MAG: UbiX family flavin prenyltransferase [Nitrospirae bacterium]|nr:UbiX family flavin prenyltransferase [Nitrospirota bacterium]MBF0540371.1 UbiX family flavin prenyltransferase [Nitrospirota bacterium]
MKRYIIAITGASGSILGINITKELLINNEVHLIISNHAFDVINSETEFIWQSVNIDEIKQYFNSDRLFIHDTNNQSAPISSGSFITDGMFIVPCSMKTLSAVANGYANNLITRAADVIIKEGRRLLIAPREMPFSAIHLENMSRLSRIGVIIAPPNPAFYHNPKTIDELIGYMTGKMLDLMGVANKHFKRWE